MGNTMKLLDTERIRQLCESLVGYLMRGNLSEGDSDTRLSVFAYNLLKQLVETLQWYSPENDDSSDTDQVIQSLRAFSGKYTSPPQPSLFIPSWSDDTEYTLTNSYTLWEERFLALQNI